MNRNPKPISDAELVGMMQRNQKALRERIEQLESENAKLRAELERGAVPEGWKLVPVEPTPEMLSEFKRAYKDGDFWRERMHGAVCAMLAAAPSVPKADDQVKVQLLEALTDSLELMETLCAFEGDTIRKARAAIAAARQEGGK